MDPGVKRGRGRKPRSSAEHQQKGDEEAAPECSWGEPPARLTSVGMQEGEANFGTRLR